MRFSVLALAYDGTIADQGVLDPEVRQAIRAARAHSVTVVNVTGRSLDDLRQVLGDLRLVDAVVAENAAAQPHLEGVGCSRLFGSALYPPPPPLWSTGTCPLSYATGRISHR
jgi:hypothetical protein